MKLYPLFTTLLVLSSFLSCKNDAAKTEVAPDGTVLPTNPEGIKVPSACTIVTIDWIKSNLGLMDKNVIIKDASDPTKKDYTSCFFKWENSAQEPDAGILIQVMINPVYDEFPQWVTKFISAKITEGENVMGGEAPVKYKKFDAGVEGAYSYDMKRFYWRNDDKFLFMLAFNVMDDESTMVAKAKKIVDEINKNFKG